MSNNETNGEHSNVYRISNDDRSYEENTNQSTKENHHYVLVEHRAEEFLEWDSQSLNQRGQDDTVSKQTGDETDGSLNKPRTGKLEKTK
ncbi:hypothetical protein VCV18_011461 [Metarhizium anisopliae]